MRCRILVVQPKQTKGVNQYLQTFNPRKCYLFIVLLMNKIPSHIHTLCHKHGYNIKFYVWDKYIFRLFNKLKKTMNEKCSKGKHVWLQRSKRLKKTVVQVDSKIYDMVKFQLTPFNMRIFFFEKQNQNFKLSLNLIYVHLVYINCDTSSDD